ncbi:hypothetical protein BofuT4_P073490.1 [Botrytis cinerea T4]|uniref:Uncharacterized protein n=1 Tax=Botryotinia fuckeliana (strain T4) TaxID=999810 RepID=G2XPD1_BOTF4|nr:hypothetical protein BofuT4_P073490.1 [Botrytis cinerea T4]
MPPRTLRKRSHRASSRDPHSNTNINADPSANANTNTTGSPNTITVRTTTTTTTTMMVDKDGVEVEGSRRVSGGRTSTGGRTSIGSGEKRQRGLAEFGITRSPHPQGKKRTREVEKEEEEEEEGDEIGNTVNGGSMANGTNGTIIGPMSSTQDQEHINTPKRRRISTTNRVNGSITVTGTGGRETPRERTRERDVTVSMENSLPSPPAEAGDNEHNVNSVEGDIGRSSPLENNRAGSTGTETETAKNEKENEEEKDEQRERNIDEVVFGDLCFKKC